MTAAFASDTELGDPTPTTCGRVPPSSYASAQHAPPPGASRREPPAARSSTPSRPTAPPSPPPSPAPRPLSSVRRRRAPSTRPTSPSSARSGPSTSSNAAASPRKRPRNSSSGCSTPPPNSELFDTAGRLRLRAPGNLPDAQPPSQPIGPPTHDLTLTRGSARLTTYLRHLRASSTYAAHAPAWTADRLPLLQRSPALPQAALSITLSSRLGPRSRSTLQAAYANRALENLPEAQPASANYWPSDVRPDSHPALSYTTRPRRLRACQTHAMELLATMDHSRRRAPGGTRRAPPAALPALAAYWPPDARPDAHPGICPPPDPPSSTTGLLNARRARPGLDRGSTPATSTEPNTATSGTQYCLFLAHGAAPHYKPLTPIAHSRTCQKRSPPPATYRPSDARPAAHRVPATRPAPRRLRACQTHAMKLLDTADRSRRRAPGGTRRAPPAALPAFAASWPLRRMTRRSSGDLPTARPTFVNYGPTQRTPRTSLPGPLLASRHFN